MNKKKIFIIILLLILLVLVRFFEKQLFNDGLIEFFQQAYLSENIPKLFIIRIILINTIHFIINSILSIAILNTLFQQPKLLKFLIFFYFIIYLISILFFYYQLINYQSGKYLYLFYIRRLIIQPLLLFILIPALYYQRKK